MKNFVKINSESEYHKYYDEQGIVLLHILKSGWEDKYHCILEFGEYDEFEHYLYTSQEIYEHYEINIKD
jgi:hypothetical protein